MPRVVVELHKFEPAIQDDPNPQELVCVCGAKIARQGTEEQLTNTGWYFIEGPATCPVKAAEDMKPAPTPPNG
jgi:hypothetical protein